MLILKVFGKFKDAGSRMYCVINLLEAMLVRRLEVGSMVATRFTSSGYRRSLISE